MGIRELAKEWIVDNHPELRMNDMRASKYYPDNDIWFFTFPCDYFDKNRAGSVNILLQHKDRLNQFYLLKIPYEFFRENQSKFDISRLLKNS